MICCTGPGRNMLGFLKCLTVAAFLICAGCAGHAQHDTAAHPLPVTTAKPAVSAGVQGDEGANMACHIYGGNCPPP